MKRIVTLALLFALAPPVMLTAEDVKLLIVYAEGRGFLLNRGGATQFIDFAASSPVGFELKAGDAVNVEARTTFEFQLFPFMTVVKAAESSSFTIKAVHPTGACDIDVAYGRLRTKTDDQKASADFLYSGVAIAAASAGTDFGFDRVFGEGKALAPVVSCFQGSLSVSQTAAGAAGVKVVDIAPLEMVRVNEAASGASVLLKSGLGAEVKSFWQKNDFKTRPARSTVKPAPEETAVAKSDALTTVPPETKTAAKDETPPAKTDQATAEEKKSAPETKAPEPEAKPVERPETAMVDVTENSLGVREKLSALDEKDIIVNPDFGKEKTAVTAPVTAPVTTPAPAPDAKEAKKDEAAKTDAAQPAPQQNPPPAAASPPAVGFALDFGLEIDYLLSFTPPTLTAIPGLEWLVGLLDFFMRLKIGGVASANLMFFDIIGIGVEAGFLYNEITTQDAFLQPIIIHFFTIPLCVDIRLTLGPVLFQPHAGIVLPGALAGGNLVFGLPWYEIGAKLGIRLGGMTIFVNFGLMAPTIETLFTSTAEMRLGGGLLFKIF